MGLPRATTRGFLFVLGLLTGVQAPTARKIHGVSTSLKYYITQSPLSPQVGAFPGRFLALTRSQAGR